MKAVFLDRGTFSEGIELPAPSGVSDYMTYESTPADSKVIIERCQEADIIITNKVKINAEVISRLPKLKLIQLTATGMNNVDKEACDAHNVTLYNVAGYAVKSVPEHTFMLMVMALRAGIHYHEKVVNGSWAPSNLESTSILILIRSVTRSSPQSAVILRSSTSVIRGSAA